MHEEVLFAAQEILKTPMFSIWTPSPPRHRAFMRDHITVLPRTTGRVPNTGDVATPSKKVEKTTMNTN